MPSRGVYRGVHSVLFDDPDYRRLSPNARLVLLTLRLCRDAGPAAIFEFSLDTLERQTGLPRRSIDACLTSLEADGWIERDDSLVWIRNGLRYDPILRPSNPLHMTAVTKWILGLPKRLLIVKFCDYYKIANPWGGAMPYPPPNKEKEKDKEKQLEAGGALVAPATSRSTHHDAPASKFHIPPPIADALAKCPTFATVPRLTDPAWWQAEVRANNERGVNYAAEVLKAQAWIVSNPQKAPRSNVPAFLHRWFARSHGADS